MPFRLMPALPVTRPNLCYAISIGVKSGICQLVISPLLCLAIISALPPVKAGLKHRNFAVKLILHMTQSLTKR